MPVFVRFEACAGQLLGCDAVTRSEVSWCCRLAPRPLKGKNTAELQEALT